MADRLRPVPTDPSAAEVGRFFDLRSEAWLLTVPGDYQTAAVETWRADGANWQRLIALEWPARLNHDRTRTTVRLLISPEDAEGLAGVLRQTAAWLRAAAVIEGDGG